MAEQSPQETGSPAVTVNVFLSSGRMLTHVNPFSSTAELEGFIRVMNMCGSENMAGTLLDVSKMGHRFGPEIRDSQDGLSFLE